MKKLIALLIACTAMTCSFVSCGDEDEESSANDTSVFESSTDDSSDDSIEEDTTEEIEEELEEVTEENIEVTTVEKTTHEYIEDADKTAFLGKWECTKLVVDGESLTELAGLPIYSVFQYDLLDDGTVELPDSLMEIADSENPVTYTWEQSSDNEIEIIGSNGSSISFTLQDGQLVNIEGTEEIYLDKVAEFTYFDFKSYYDQLMAEQAEQDEQQYVLTPVETDANGEVISTGEPIVVE